MLGKVLWRDSERFVFFFFFSGKSTKVKTFEIHMENSKSFRLAGAKSIEHSDLVKVG